MPIVALESRRGDRRQLFLKHQIEERHLDDERRLVPAEKAKIEG